MSRVSLKPAARHRDNRAGVRRRRSLEPGDLLQLRLDRLVLPLHSVLQVADQGEQMRVGAWARQQTYVYSNSKLQRILFYL